MVELAMTELDRLREEFEAARVRARQAKKAHNKARSEGQRSRLTELERALLNAVQECNRLLAAIPEGQGFEWGSSAEIDRAIWNADDAIEGAYRKQWGSAYREPEGRWRK